MKKKKSKAWLAWVLIAILTAGLAALPMLASETAASSGVRTEILSAKAEFSPISTQIVSGGQLASTEVYSLEIPKNVKLKQLLVNNGDTVRTGDIIAQIDSVTVMSAIADVQNALTDLTKQINSAASASTTSSLTTKVAGRVKAVYAQSGDNVQDVMLRYGALAVIALDDTMAVKLETTASYEPGDRLQVSLTSGTTVTGRVRSCISGELVVSIPDDKYAIGTMVSVFDTDGHGLGYGPLYVLNAWNLTAYDGTVTYVQAKEEATVYANQGLFTIRTSGVSAEYQRLVDQRQEYEALMEELIRMYRSGVITAPCDGIVSGVDAAGSYMLSSSGDTGSLKVVLLSDTQYSLEIQTTALPEGTVGSSYHAALSAALIPSDGTHATPEGTWHIDDLPLGLSYEESTGIISGTPRQAGTYTVNVTFSTVSQTAYASLILTVNASTAPYIGYVAKINYAQSDTINADVDPTPYSISDLTQLPSVTPNPNSMTLTDQPFSGAGIDASGLKKDDYVWIIVDAANPSMVVKVTKVSSSGTPSGGSMPSGGSAGGFGGASGFGGTGGSGRSGSGGTAEEELYSLDKLTIGSVTSQEHMTISITIDELDIPKIYIGQHASVTMNSLSGEAMDAVVTDIGSSGENSGGSSKFTVELVLAKTNDILPGMHATVVITLQTWENALCIPAEAVYTENGRSIVYTALDQKTGKPKDPIVITTGTANADTVMVVSGLSEGQTIYYEHYEPETGAMPL